MAAPRNLVVISDTHVGCRLGLCPPKFSLDDGGVYSPSKFQQKLHAIWLEFWEWVEGELRGEPYDLVHNGDAIDGVHHSSTTQISHNIQDQVNGAFDLLRPVVAKVQQRGGRYYHIRGTEAHVGKSALHEEQLARMLGAVPNEEGQYARWELFKRVGETRGRVKAPLVHLLHHIGTTGSAAHEASAVNAELTAIYVECARWGNEPPDYVVRSHRHRFFDIGLNSSKGFVYSIVTPGWQGKTPFVYKIPGARLSTPQIGGVLIRQGERQHYFNRFVKTFERPREEA